MDEAQVTFVAMPPAPSPQKKFVLGVLGVQGCCGIREIKDLAVFKRTPEKAMASFAQVCYTPDADYPRGRCAFRYAIFSEARQSGYGEEFAAFIKANRFGNVVETGVNVNPNSGNALKVWLWTVAHNHVRAWALINNVKGVTAFNDTNEKVTE